MLLVKVLTSCLFAVTAFSLLMSIHVLFTHSFSSELTGVRTDMDRGARIKKVDMSTKVTVSDLVEQCIHGTNISDVPSQMLQHVKANAEFMFEEFRKVIPEKSLDGYGSYCWRESYSVHLYICTVGTLET